MVLGNTSIGRITILISDYGETEAENAINLSINS